MDNLLLLEALADISYIAGTEKFYGGDSREDIANFIDWAKEFEALHMETKWGFDLDYIETITSFAMEKISQSKISAQP